MKYANLEYEIKNGKYINTKTKKQLSDKDTEAIKQANKEFSEYRHYKNSQFILFKIVRLIKKQKNKKNEIIKKHEKEIERLNRVIQSKQKWANSYKGGVIEWQDGYLKNPGIFNVGVDVVNGKEYLIDFAVNANILIGGCPGSGKTKLSQLLAYQAILQGSKVHIGDFKGGTDFSRFGNKCNVVITHKELISLLQSLMAEHKNRIKKFLQVGAENIVDYNKITGENLLREYLIIDELGEAMEIIDIDIASKAKKEMEKTIENYVKSLARLGRATGINLIFGTQRPDVGILNGQTRDQFLKRICFQSVRNTSQIVLDSPIATEIGENDKGRCYVSRNINFDSVQIYLFKKDMIKNLPNMDKKGHLKLINSDKNTIDKNNVELVDYEID